MREVIGLGVAGNFAGHLEQAGEAADFVGVETRDARAPKGVFPFYVPVAAARADAHFLHTYPISADTIRIPGPEDKLQIEPEVGLLCGLEYAGGAVSRIVPKRFGAHNDCSIRRPGAKKISEKKNWGPCSKGISDTLLPIDTLSKGGVLDHFRLACWLERDGALHAYGVDSAVSSYSYFHDTLLDWLVEKLNGQAEAGPLESIAGWLEVAGHPAEALISIGATRYTDYGETHFLEPGDRSIVAVYDAELYTAEAVEALVADPEAVIPAGMSVLSQRVVAD